MAFASKKVNLDLFYNMFKTEYETSMRNIEACKEKADHIYEHVQRSWESIADMQACLFNYDKALTDISQLADKLRKFNLQIELDTIQNTKEPPEERFTFPQPSLLQNEKGYEAECVVTYIKDAKNKLFYFTEIGANSSTEDIVKKMQTYFQDKPRELEQPPKNGEVFGLHLEGYMFRAVKENGSADKFSNFNAFLIDVGEIVTISECMPMYSLPEDYRKLPAQAVLCKLEQLNVNDVNISEYLAKSLYVKHKFRIVDKDRNMLFVDLMADTNPFRTQMLSPKDSTATNEKPVQQIMNPFKRYLCIKTKIDRSQINFSDFNNFKQSVSNVKIENSVVINDHSVFNERGSSHSSDYQGAITTNQANACSNGFEYNRNNENYSNVNFNNNVSNGFDMTYMNQVLSDTMKSRNDNSNREMTNVNGVNTLTEEQMQMLYEEPLNTTNAMKAVLGYDPQDDKRICNFYDPATNSCFKGASCRKEHVEKIPEGWTRDQAPTIVDIANQIVFPRVGDHITIIPTHIINAENFFGQLVQMESRYEPSLKELIYKMNSPEIMHSYRILKSMPVLFELVIAKYTDGFWYRAKILNVMDDDAVKVFYVDYGNSRVVSNNEIRQWDRRFEYLPFQAVRCKVAGIAEKRSRPLEAAEQLRKMILNLSIKARVLNNIEHLDLQLWDVYNNDVAEELISMNLVERREIHLLRTNQILPA